MLVLKSGTVRIKRTASGASASPPTATPWSTASASCCSARWPEWPEEIDERLAREEEAREKEKLRQAQSQREFLITKANLAHAMARLRAVSRPQHQQPVNAAKEGERKTKTGFPLLSLLFSPP